MMSVLHNCLYKQYFGSCPSRKIRSQRECWSHTHMHTHAHAHTRARGTHARTHAHTLTHTHTHTHIYIYIYTHTYIFIQKTRPVIIAYRLLLSALKTENYSSKKGTGYVKIRNPLQIIFAQIKNTNNVTPKTIHKHSATSSVTKFYLYQRMHLFLNYTKIT